MKNAKCILFALMVIGCASADRGLLAMDWCVYDCERIAAECHLTGYPAHGHTCEQACEGMGYISPVDPDRACVGDMEANHFIRCEECLLGDTRGPACDFASEFDPAGYCFGDCQRTSVDRILCGHSP